MGVLSDLARMSVCCSDERLINPLAPAEFLLKVISLFCFPAVFGPGGREAHGQVSLAQDNDAGFQQL